MKTDLQEKYDNSYQYKREPKTEETYILKDSSPSVTNSILQQIMDSSSFSFEDRISSNQDLTFDYLSTKFEKKHTTLTNKDLESLCLSMDGKYTRLGFILSDQSHYTLKIASYTDDFKTAFIDRAEIRGCILKQIDEARAFISRHNRNSSIISGKYREDKWDYSEASIRIALANAMIQRDYAIDDPVLISIFPSKITIVSPGNFRVPSTIEELMSEIQYLRNRRLAVVLYKLKMIKADDIGAPHIFSSYKDLEVNPTIVNGYSTFTITLPAETDIEKTAIQVFLERKTEFTRAELEESLGISKSEAVSEINILLKTRNIVKVGQGRSTKYKVRRIV